MARNINKLIVCDLILCIKIKVINTELEIQYLTI